MAGNNFLEPEILEKCNLRQACEYIAFGWEPLEEIYEKLECRNRQIDNYDAEIEQARLKLILAFIKGGLSLYANKGYFYSDINGDEKSEIHEEVDIFEPLEKFFLNELYLDPNININENCFFYGYLDRENTGDYSCVSKYESFVFCKVNFIELKDLFSRKSIPSVNYGSPFSSKEIYTSPYIEIMLEVIKEQKITKQNQMIKKQIVYLLEEKMKTKNLPTSKNLAEAMATLIRLPQSQKGKANKQKK